ncbi:hypothetical protein B0H14DRAFT_3505836 [Mycena olivaceomarginata]|nr:hypothetical protein B0H14DRAFT_3505836 [Mycena olivaceomarginata]
MDPRAARRGHRRAPPPLPSCLPPFSLIELCALIPAALDFDSPARHWRSPCAPHLRRCSARRSAPQPSSCCAAVIPLPHLSHHAMRFVSKQRRRRLAFAPYLPLAAQYERGLAVLELLLHLCISSPGPSSSSPTSPPASESPCASASSSAAEPSHARLPSPIAPIISTFSDSTCTSEERQYFVLAADAPFPYDGVDSDRAQRAPRRETHAWTIRVFTSRRSKKPDWTLALPSSPSSTSQASFDPPRTSMPLPRAGSSSPSSPESVPTSSSPSSLTCAPPRIHSHRDLAPKPVQPWSSLAPELAAPAPAPAPTERDD